MLMGSSVAAPSISIRTASCDVRLLWSLPQAVPAAVELALRGSREALGRVDADDIVAFIDLAGLGPGQYSLTVHADSSSDVGVTRVEPASVQVRITSGKH